MSYSCLNRVIFYADAITLSKIEALFTEMALKESAHGGPQLPGFIHSDTGHMIEIRIEDGVIYYETYLTPNVLVLTSIAALYKASFHYECETLQLDVYAEYEYKNGVLSAVALEQEDFESYYYDETLNCYQFEGRCYEVEHEILDILLKRRKKKQ